jgi:hypothetical protein
MNNNNIRCSNNDCYFYTNNFFKFKSKLIGDDGYYYCKQCSINKEREEDAFIESTINTYNHYLKNKNKKIYEDKNNIPLRLDKVVKYKYLSNYINHQIPKHEETIIKDNKKYILIEENDFNELEVLLWLKNIKFEKLIEQKQEKITKQTSTDLNEDEKERLLKEQEERKRRTKELVYQDKIRRDKKEREFIKQQKLEKIEQYKDVPLPENYKEEDKKIKKCDYCKGHRCFPFEFLISEKEEKRRKSYIGIICDYCIEQKEYEKEQKTIICECGGTYYNTKTRYNRHCNSKKHYDWWMIRRKTNWKKEKEYYTYKLDDLRKLCAKNTEANGKIIIEGYYKLKKEELLKEIIRIDKEGLLLIQNII